MTQVSKILGGRRRESVAEAKLPLTQNINFNNTWKKKKRLCILLPTVCDTSMSLIWAKFIHCGIVLY